MKYLKAPISISEQIEKLRERGLLFYDEQKATNYQRIKISQIKCNNFFNKS